MSNGRAKLTLGARGEEIAAAYVRARGYDVGERNYHCRYGEIDLVCRHQGTVVFCEVKLRRSGAYGLPEEAVTARKVRRLTLTAQTYLMERGLEDADWRLDVVAIELDRQGAVARIDLYQAIDA